MMVETSVFAPHVEKQIEYVMKSPPIGLCQKIITFFNPRASCPNYKGDAKCDHVKMRIPFAGSPIDCLVMFQATLPSCPPDFIFQDSRFVVPLEELPILRNWDVRRADGLLETVKQLMRYFKMKHLRLMENYRHIRESYSSLISSAYYTEDDIEVFVPADKTQSISLLIRLHPDFRRVPSAYFKNPEARKYLLLYLTYVPDEKCSPVKKLYFSNELEYALGLALNFEFPPFSPKVTLGEYVQVLENELSNKAEMVALGYEIRKKYMAMFVSRLENCIVEFDVLLFRKLAFLIKHKGHHIVVEIDLTSIYPLPAPVITFRSLYHSYQGIPTSVQNASYPYSTDWPIERIFEETMMYIDAYLPTFPEDSLSINFEKKEDDRRQKKN